MDFELWTLSFEPWACLPNRRSTLQSRPLISHLSLLISHWHRKVTTFNFAICAYWFLLVSFGFFFLQVAVYVWDKFSACVARGRSTDALPRAYRCAAVSAPTAREQSAPCRMASPECFSYYFCWMMSMKAVQCKVFQAECKLLQEDVNICRNM